MFRDGLDMNTIAEQDSAPTKKPEQVGLFKTTSALDYLLAIASNCLALIICPLRPGSLPFLP